MNDRVPRKIIRIYLWIQGLNIPLYAANTGFFIILSLFPALLLLLSALRFTGLQVADLMDMMDGVFPAALMGTVRDLVMGIYENATGAFVGVSALTALWSSSRGIYSLLTGLNAIYGVSENRSYLYTRGISVLYTFLLGIVMLLTLILHVFGGILRGFLLSLSNPALSFLLRILDVRFFFLLVVQSILFTLMFTFLPNRHNRLLESLPGGLLASIGWLVFSNLYSVYVTHFSYVNIYGSVYAIALNMLWLYFCMSILFLGGALNRLLTMKEIY